LTRFCSNGRIAEQPPSSPFTGPHPAPPPQAPAPQAAAPRSPLPRGRKPRGKVTRKDLSQLDHLSVLQGYLHRLRSVYVHPNRVLFFDDVVTVYVLAFFNPTLRSLRCIEDASRVEQVNRNLDVDAVCKSTLSDANALFDPEHLGGLIQDLRRHLPNLHQVDGQLDQLLKQIEIFDGSFFRVASDVAWAVQGNNQHTKAKGTGGGGYIRLDCQFCLKTGSVSGVSVHGNEGVSEGAAAEAMVEPEPDKIYLFDSGVTRFTYLQKIRSVGSHFLCCLSNKVNFTELPEHEQRKLTDADRAAGVISDRIGTLPGSDHCKAPEERVREILVRYTDRSGVTKTLRLLTDLLDLPAHVVAELYKSRWQIELFFRWLKVHAHFRHLTSHSKNGVALGFHIAVIAMLLTSLMTQKSLSKYGYNVMAMIASGMTTPAEALPILENRERQARRQRELQAIKRAAAQAAKKQA
jgi:hypothetical protein